MIGSSLITLSKLKKKTKKEGYLFQKLYRSTELLIRTLYVSPEFANPVSGSGLPVMLFFGLFPRIQYLLFGGAPDGHSIFEHRSYQRLKEARKRMPFVVSD